MDEWGINAFISKKMLNDFGLSDLSYEEQIIQNIVDDDNTCCKTKMFLDTIKSIYLCKSCGRSTKTIIDDSTFQTKLQTSNNPTEAGIKISGKDSYKYQRGLYASIKRHPDSAKKSRRRQIAKFINLLNGESKKFKLTKDIIEDVLDLYEDLVTSGQKSHRGRVKIAILASLTFLAMNQKKITKPFKQISNFYGLGLKKSGQGARLISKQKQPVRYKTNIYQDYLCNVCHHLGIMKFAPLLKDWLTHLGDIRLVYGESQARTGTRVCSLIVILKRIKPELDFLIKDVYKICFLSNISTKKFISVFIYNNRKELNQLARKRYPKFPKIKKKHCLLEPSKKSPARNGANPPSNRVLKPPPRTGQYTTF